ncbi:hypothetical protein E1N52_42545 [Paraburkholderia guartelaensis]|uniref:Uncharacterized protein n=1 Tax=Paraburkholderia guartelaensis TaxID=2546446 RepID=A0A4R5L2U9_9BURK|nr:hypothetical protein [Paraburkholderia guartelaensis]TDG01909.1 hypothetical protein E1N52_42545 [Paraburkholderia guartelaensis]
MQDLAPIRRCAVCGGEQSATPSLNGISARRQLIDDPELVAASSGLITFDASSWTMNDHLISFVTSFVVLFIPNPITENQHIKEAATFVPA